MNKYTSLDEVVSEAATFLPSSTPEERNIMRQWAWRCLRRLPMPSYAILEDKIMIEDGSFKKPCGMESLITFSLSDSQDREIRSKLLRTGRRINEDLIDRTDRLVEVFEDENYYYIDSRHYDVVESMDIKYKGYPIDDYEEPKIPEIYTEAISNYILWRYYQSKGIPYGQVQQDFFREEARVKSKIKAVSTMEAQEIGRKWMSLIPNFKEKYK